MDTTDKVFYWAVACGRCGIMLPQALIPSMTRRGPFGRFLSDSKSIARRAETTQNIGKIKCKCGWGHEQLRSFIRIQLSDSRPLGALKGYCA